MPQTLQGSYPSWSPTGRQIAFATPGESGIDIINANGTGLRRLTRDIRSGGSLPSWSARNVIAFVRGPGPGQIYTVKPDGSGLRQITRSSGSSYPSWSPSGRLIAFVTAAGAIDVANPNGSSAHTVSPKGWTSSNPTWTRSGKVVFVAEPGIRISTYIVNPDGTGLRRLYPSLEGAQSGAAGMTWGVAALPAGKCNSAPPS